MADVGRRQKIYQVHLEADRVEEALERVAILLVVINDEDSWLVATGTLFSRMLRHEIRRYRLREIYSTLGWWVGSESRASKPSQWNFRASEPHDGTFMRNVSALSATAHLHNPLAATDLRNAPIRIARWPLGGVVPSLRSQISAGTANQQGQSRKRCNAFGGTSAS